MRIVIDFQGAQCGSRHRGIGRYTTSLALAMVRQRGEHEIIIALNGLFHDSIEPIRAAFDGLLPQANIRVWYATGPVHAFDEGNRWRRGVAELTREAFLASLKPDIVHVTSMMEGFGDDAVHSIGLLPVDIAYAVTFYDLIPLIQSDVYLEPNPLFKRLYEEKLDHLRQASLFLAISESARSEAIEYLGVPAEAAVNIAAATDDYFCAGAVPEPVARTVREKFALTKPFVMYSGATDERKNHLRLIKAFSLLPADLRDSHQLAIVGGLPKDHRERFEKFIELCGLPPGQVVITGRVSDAEMVSLYRLCKLFVFPSWHEGFGLPALEAMSCGAPVIASNNTSLPEVMGREDALFNPFDEVAISAKIAEVLRDDALRLELAAHGLRQSRKFSWEESARRTLAAFERWFENRRGAPASAPAGAADLSPQDWVIGKIAQLPFARPSRRELMEVARMLTLNQAPGGDRQLLVDISEIVQRDAKTGIQRVVKSVIKELLEHPPEGFRVELVYGVHDRPGYRYARAMAASFRETGEFGRPDTATDYPVELSRADVFLGLDLNHVVLSQASFYRTLRELGVATYFVLYDLAPVSFPAFFPADIPDLHARWLGVLAGSDGVVCISRAVADDFAEWLDFSAPTRLRALPIGWFHLGADIENSAPSSGLPTESDAVFAAMDGRPSFLSVGTLEPRKGQTQTLLAFEELWREGVDVNLVLVGKQGWNVGLLADMLKTHGEFGKRLFWLSGVSDQYLEGLYAKASCLIAASESEGFGLPLIEAARHKLPVIARDIPVFREVAGGAASYFSGLDATSLAQAVSGWLRADAQGRSPSIADMRWLTWRESAAALLSVVVGQNWSNRWSYDGVRRFWASDPRLGTQVGLRHQRQMKTTARNGYLFFGPYLRMAMGRYRVVLHGEATPELLQGAKFDVSGNKGRDIYCDGEFVCSAQNDILAIGEFVLEQECPDLEVRVWVSAASALAVTSVSLEPLVGRVDGAGAPPAVPAEPAVRPAPAEAEPLAQLVAAAEVAAVEVAVAETVAVEAAPAPSVRGAKRNAKKRKS